MYELLDCFYCGCCFSGGAQVLPEYALVNFCMFWLLNAGRAAEAAIEAILGAEVRREEAIVEDGCGCGW